MSWLLTKFEAALPFDALERRNRNLAFGMGNGDPTRPGGMPELDVTPALRHFDKPRCLQGLDHLTTVHFK